ncbi:hypothetical protein C8R46DRAFT_1042595 [Mycena filopes]|nr:hypothetical protein C8R46DRAFT_1042595 [Mycena filopes]
MVCTSKDEDQDTVAAADLQHHIEMQNARIEVLEQKHDARIEELEKKHDTERTERTVAESMKWALEQENAELRQCSRSTREQRSVVERGQEGAIQTLQECIKTAARLSAEQATRVQVLEERVTEKDGETDEVAKLAEELATKVPRRKRCAAEVQQALRQGYAQEVGERVGLGGRGDEDYEGEARRAAEWGLQSRRRDRVCSADF